ncbi:class Ia ribonucleoside-diphosphate reductase subunit beta [Marinifilum sp.]|uniref:class Ia ribonucleoside-diphosphate reductase subunit beta n=1 Tax=Marinifilum sp. TaxID=2033137 RepID=UPI003BABC321
MTNKPSLYNDNKIDFLTEKMFFGQGKNVQRYDIQKYPFYENLSQRMLSFFWRPEEISLIKDINDFNTLSEQEKFIFTENLKYQILLDSVQGRSPFLTFGQVVTLPEVEEAIIIWDFFETIHSMSYSYIIKNVYTSPEKIFDDIMTNEMIVERAGSVTDHYNDFYHYLIKYQAQQLGMTDKNTIELEDLKKKLYLALVSVNILEGVRFYVSFACSFAFAENKKMEGNAKIIKFIARDENEHLAITQKMIRDLRSNEEEGFAEIIEGLDDEVYAMYKDAAEQEMRWAEYLFEKGSIIGLNDKLLIKYMKHMTDKRLKGIGLKPIYNEKNNPLSWMDHWLRNDAVEVLPQETEISSYVVGGIDMDVNDDDFNV